MTAPAFRRALSLIVLGTVACTSGGGEKEAGRDSAASTAALQSALAAITSDNILQHVNRLASDGFEGRAPGTAGEDSSVAYITEQFKAIGLAPGNSDGTYIHQLSVFYKSPKRANAEMKKHLKDAVEIIRRQPFLDEKGVQVGEVFVATFAPYKGSSVTSPELLWTEGSRYVTQRRSSLQSILDDLDANR